MNATKFTIVFMLLALPVVVAAEVFPAVAGLLVILSYSVAGLFGYSCAGFGWFGLGVRMDNPQVPEVEIEIVHTDGTSDTLVGEEAILFALKLLERSSGGRLRVNE